MARQRIKQEHDRKLKEKLKRIREEQVKEMGEEEEIQSEEIVQARVPGREAERAVRDAEKVERRKGKEITLEMLEEPGIEEEERESR